METYEHKELGDRIQFHTISDNPYLFKDETGILHVKLMRLVGGIPNPDGDLILSAGDIVAMSGDYYTRPGWAMSFDIPHEHSNANQIELGRFLIEDPVKSEELLACADAYDDLSGTATPKEIATIYKIKKKKYIPFSSTLSHYIQELMLYLKVKNYGDKTDKNEAHFIPWSIRAYIIGHTLALQNAEISYELERIAKSKHYNSSHPQVNLIKEAINQQHHLSALDEKQRKIIFQEMAYRYHALAVAIELANFHYYSDSFAAGHMSRLGFLRSELPRHFTKILGGLLANSMHNEDNRLGVNVKEAYDPSPEDWYANPSTGDGHMNDCKNLQNKANCIKGMSLSLMEIEAIRQGRRLPAQTEYSGFDEFPMVDPDQRQTQPMFILFEDKIYRRKSYKKVKMLSPTEYQDLISHDPTTHGYTRLRGKLDAFFQDVKLRTPFFKGKVKPLSAEELAAIEADEKSRNPDIEINENPPCQEKGIIGAMKAHGLMYKKKKEKTGQKRGGCIKLELKMGGL